MIDLDSDFSMKLITSKELYIIKDKVVINKFKSLVQYY